jgi:hypothetical protein
MTPYFLRSTSLASCSVEIGSRSHRLLHICLKGLLLFRCLRGGLLVHLATSGDQIHEDAQEDQVMTKMTQRALGWSTTGPLHSTYAR